MDSPRSTRRYVLCFGMGIVQVSTSNLFQTSCHLPIPMEWPMDYLMAYRIVCPKKFMALKKIILPPLPTPPPPYGYVASPEEEGCGKKAPRDDAKGHCTPSTRGLTGRSIPLCTSLIKQPSAPQKGPNMLVSFYFMVI